MFKKKSTKPSIQVLKVKTEKREVVNEDITSYGYSSNRRTKKKTTKNVNFTVVLLAKDGVLCTREFNGSWNMTDVKKWEDL